MFTWIEHRTGAFSILRKALLENIPGGARWRYIWGSTLTFTFFVQVVTGMVLWMAYSPSAQTAWESVFYIQHEMVGGWLLRGVHHFTAQAMNILLVLHLMQVLIDGAYKAPREVNFWFGIALLGLVLALSLTGYLLPWDQKGFWATKVSTSIIAITPGLGSYLERLVVGGPEYGHHTLTRFFALHAGILPAMVTLLVLGHLALFRRHGVTPKRPLKRPDAMFWPDQVLRDAIACLAVFAAILFFVVKSKIPGVGGPLGADLGAPADASESYAAARPEWYFLFLFQFLKYFPGATEIYGALIIPAGVLMIICLMPLIGRWKLGHGFNLAFLVALLGGVGYLTYAAVEEDRHNAAYKAAVALAERQAKRVVLLAQGPAGIPPEGAVTLLRNDPLTQGPKIFAAHCASCHRYAGHDGTGGVPSEEPKASDLEGFASRRWLRGLLDPDQVSTARYFGSTKFHAGKMARFVHRKVAKFDEEEKGQLQEAIIALSAEAALPAQDGVDIRDAPVIEAGKGHFLDDVGCADCHEFHFVDEDATGPDLTGYGSREWLVSFVTNPAHPRFYGEKNDRMPAFGKEGILDSRQIELVVDWLRGEWYRPGGGDPIR